MKCIECGFETEKLLDMTKHFFINHGAEFKRRLNKTDLEIEIGTFKLSDEWTIYGVGEDIGIYTQKVRNPNALLVLLDCSHGMVIETAELREKTIETYCGLCEKTVKIKTITRQEFLAIANMKGTENNLKTFELVDPNRGGEIVDVMQLTHEEAIARNKQRRDEGSDLRWIKAENQKQ